MSKPPPTYRDVLEAAGRLRESCLLLDPPAAALRAPVTRAATEAEQETAELIETVGFFCVSSAEVMIRVCAR